MNDMARILPGIERVRTRFLEMLDERQARIASHALAAWDGETVEEINGNLGKARDILHQISGSAGSLGFADLGDQARYCEAEIIRHLDGPDADLAICPGGLINLIDDFTTECRAILEDVKDNIFAPDAEPVT